MSYHQENIDLKIPSDRFIHSSHNHQFTSSDLKKIKTRVAKIPRVRNPTYTHTIVTPTPSQRVSIE